MSYECLACGKSIATGSSKCPACGFPVMGAAQSNPEILAQMKEVAKEYIKNIIGEYAIGIQSYQYVFKDGKIQLDKTIETEIVGYDKLMTNEILWSDKAYKGIEQNKPVNLQIYVQKKGGSKQKQNISIKPPTGMAVTYIGVKRDGVSAQVVWGNKDKYTTSTNFKLVL